MKSTESVEKIVRAVADSLSIDESEADEYFAEMLQNTDVRAVMDWILDQKVSIRTQGKTTGSQEKLL